MSKPDDRSAMAVGRTPFSDNALGDWETGAFNVTDGGVIRVNMTRPVDGAFVEVVITPTGTEERPLMRTSVGDVAYWEFSGVTGHEAAELARAVGRTLENEGSTSALTRVLPHVVYGKDGSSPQARALLAAQPMAQLTAAETSEGSNDTTALVAAHTKTHLLLDPPGIAEFLAPEFTINGEPIDGWVLRAICAPPVARSERHRFDAWLLEFEREGELAQILLGAPSARPSWFGVANQLAVSFFRGNFGREGVPIQLASVCSWLLFIAGMKQAKGFQLTVPENADSVRAMSVPARQDTVTVGSKDNIEHTENQHDQSAIALNLAVDAECGQNCVFCSVKSFVTPQDGGTDELAHIRQQMQAARLRGTQHLRLNGIDPMAYSRVIDVAKEAQSLQFTKMTVYTTGRRFANRAFAQQFLEASPRQTRIVIPLYGVTAEIHDTVTGTPGSHKDVVDAIEILLSIAGPEHLAISTVIVKQNIDEVLQIAAFAVDRNINLETHLAYPMRQSLRDPYADSALRESEVVSRILSAGGQGSKGHSHMHLDLLLSVMSHPCVLWSESNEFHSLLPNQWRSRPKRELDGTEYDSDRFEHASESSESTGAFAVATVECPQASNCALRPRCPGRHYAVYKELYGLDEFQPVAPEDLMTAGTVS